MFSDVGRMPIQATMASKVVAASASSGSPSSSVRWRVERRMMIVAVRVRECLQSVEHGVRLDFNEHVGLEQVIDPDRRQRR